MKTESELKWSECMSEIKLMQIQIALPDEVADSLLAKWGSLEHKLMEMIVIEAYREGSISVGKVRELLEMKTPLEVDAFLQTKGIDLSYNEADFEADRQTHEQLRKEGKLNTQ
jgi:predicted HTH domain antitoxin